MSPKERWNVAKLETGQREFVTPKAMIENDKFHIKFYEPPVLG